ncbi:hypothetical protein [Yinghuangia seranimata]|uniref:hypothetical protein n=1 Tax=Yinghuangia seranimata TaxID=408067 RepID=UPI00248C3B59|nr:hypothetical protein [Yinghuangia seranimata]MDI2129146.1 hypothetical protein [Yinghuangia seranimata]
MQDPMYVRTTYATGDPARIGTALDAITRDAPGLLRGQPGYQRFGLFADREVGKIMMGSWWESESARDASDAALRDRRTELLQPFATTVTTEAWQVVSYTDAPRFGPDAGARMGRVEFAPKDAGTFARTFVDAGRPGLEAIDGLVAATLLMNAKAGRAMISTIFRDQDALASARGPQAAVRGDGFQRMQASLIGLEEYEIVAMDMQEA